MALKRFEVDGFKQMIAKVVKDYPFKVVATTLRKAKTTTLNDWSAICYCDGKFYQAKNRENLEILDRVGGGDWFASGLILRISNWPGSAMGGGVWSCAWRSCHDHPRGYIDGDPPGSNPGHAGGWLSHRTMTRCIARERHHVDKQRVRDRIAEVGVVPVVRASSSREAVLAAEAVCEGGIPIVEITMTVPGALEVIRELERS